MQLVNTLILMVFLVSVGKPSWAGSPGRSPKYSLKFPHHANRERAGALSPIEVDLPSGCFQMGSPESEPGRGENEVQHRVCLNGFKIGKYEATMAEFEKFIKATGYLTDAGRNQGQPGCWSYQEDTGTGIFKWDWWPQASWKKPLGDVALSGNHPVSCVSFNDVLAYIDWLNKVTGRNYRLPTEAEWNMRRGRGHPPPSFGAIMR